MGMERNHDLNARLDAAALAQNDIWVQEETQQGQTADRNDPAPKRTRKPKRSNEVIAAEKEAKLARKAAREKKKEEKAAENEAKLARKAAREDNKTKKAAEKEARKAVREDNKTKKAAEKEARKAARKAIKDEKELTKAAEKKRKREEPDINKVKKEAKEDAKAAVGEIRKLKKELQKRNKVIIRLIGEKLTKENPDGFSTGDLTKAVRKCLPDKMTLFATTYGERAQGLGEYDEHASIRSFLYEISPSSAQYWYKFGKPTNAETPTGGFVNKALAMRNAEVGWEVSRSGKGRAKASVRGEWRFVNEFRFLDGRWNDEKYGPLPMDREKEDETRKQGIRA